uniref:Fungal lipase-type domain-containing protein n=2 Tax=Leersia perrieri TaxID=77586 RepID=A0A0D9X2P7_9ORYZ
MRFMERWRFVGVVVVALVLLLSTASHGRDLSFKHSEQTLNYSHTLALTLVEYASAVYMTDLTALMTWTCSRCNDLTQGFEMRSLIVDVENCLQSFVGVDYNLNAIIVAIRGTQENSVQNWIKDLIWKQLDLSYPNMPNAKVHSGFFSSYNNTILRLAITSAVHKARKSYGDLNVIVTGHSMGGAMASFCALDLAINLGSDSVQLMTFGQPRVGNTAFSSYFAKYVPNTIRITHGHDIVPHLPPYFSFLPHLTYHHFPREVWVNDSDGNITEQICDDSGEDPNCCRCISTWSLSIQDHFTYLGVDMEADDWSTCRIITAENVKQLQKDLASNILISKNSIDVTIVEPSSQAYWSNSG